MQFDPAATNGGPGGSTGDSTKTPSGGCSLCGFIPQTTTNTWILVMAGILGVNGLLAVKKLRSRLELARVKRRLRFANLFEPRNIKRYRTIGIDNSTPKSCMMLACRRTYY